MRFLSWVATKAMVYNEAGQSSSSHSSSSGTSWSLVDDVAALSTRVSK